MASDSLSVRREEEAAWEDLGHVRRNFAARLAQWVACAYSHKDGNYFHGRNAQSPRIVLSFKGHLLSTFCITGIVQGTGATVVNKTDKSQKVYIIGGRERK